MESIKNYCSQRLLIAGPACDMKAFDQNAELLEATDRELLEHTPTRRAWQFVSDAPALQFLRINSRRWPHLTFIVHYDCEDARINGLVRAKNGRVRQHRFKY